VVGDLTLAFEALELPGDTGQQGVLHPEPGRRAPAGATGRGTAARWLRRASRTGGTRRPAPRAGRVRRCVPGRLRPAPAPSNRSPTRRRPGAMTPPRRRARSVSTRRRTPGGGRPPVPMRPCCAAAG
jgi:hypothetical protein